MVSTLLRGVLVVRVVVVTRGAVESTTPPPGSGWGEPEMYLRPPCVFADVYIVRAWCWGFAFEAVGLRVRKW